MKFKFFVFTAGVSFAGMALGTQTTDLSNQVQVCKNGTLERRVELSYQQEGQQVPCTVSYAKPVESPDQKEVIYQANNEGGFCERKKDEFVQKLQGMGWDCTAGAEAAH